MTFEGWMRQKTHRARSDVPIAALVICLFATCSSEALAASGKDIVLKGASGAPACSACHGQNGEGQPQMGYPRLAGLAPAYIEEQLKSFGNGSRDNAIMDPIGKALKPQDRKAVAEYLSGLTPPGAKKNVPQDHKLIDQGRQIAERGDWSHGLPACSQCHGPAGMGVGNAFPKLSGQSADYIVNELNAWKKGDRRNDPMSLMAGVANKLDKQQIKAVAAYFESLDPLHPVQSAEKEDGK